MRKIGTVILAIAGLIFTLTAVTATHPQTFFAGQRFVREDNTQTLELQVDSHMKSVIPALGGALSGGRMFGKHQGRYTLTTPQGRSSGQFVWVKGPLCCRELPDQTLAFWPDSGDPWSVPIQEDGSFQDLSGMNWKLKTLE